MTHASYIIVFIQPQLTNVNISLGAEVGCGGESLPK